MKKNEHSLGEVLKAFERLPAYKDKIYLARLRQMWVEHMTKSFADSVKLVHLKKGQLYLRVESSVIRHELQISENQIRKKLNDWIGEEYISKVIIR